jgi:signal transduction histidine kinase
LVDIQALPVAALLIRDERVVAVNGAYEALIATTAESVVGRTVLDLIGIFVQATDRSMIERTAAAFFSGQNDGGHIWCDVQDAAGNTRTLRVEWRPGQTPEESVVYLLDADGEAASRRLAEGLARAAGELVRCRDEAEVLERAADALVAHGLYVTTLLIREDDPLLAYGPMRVPAGGTRFEAEDEAQLLATRPAREVLDLLNPSFSKRRATFFQNLGQAVSTAYPEGLAERLLAALPASRSVQAPLFVEERPFGALVVTGDMLTPALAGSFEMFAELVARAIETVRLRVELVQRERLAALGEAAAVMAHEVRNPIAAILNAGALLERFRPGAAGAEADLVRVIAEEAARLNRLVKDLLDLGRPLTPRIQPVDALELAERTLAVLRNGSSVGTIPIRIHAPPAPLILAVDNELVQLALGNVILNAVQASPTGAGVTVRLEEHGALGGLVVDDEGSGFPRDKVERFLEPFYTTRAQGTGIGLAVVRRVVEACGGSIEIGKSPSGGGRFTMFFSRATEKLLASR